MSHPIPLFSNDAVLLCSDGLTCVVTDIEIANVLQRYSDSPTGGGEIGRTGQPWVHPITLLLLSPE